MKQYLSAICAVFLVWAALDLLIHGMILRRYYLASSHLWRPTSEIHYVYAYLVTFAVSIVFVALYGTLIRPKSMSSALAFGLLLGLMSGLSIGFGFYSYMRLPIELAVGWCLGWLVQMLAASAVVGAIMKK